MKLTVTEVSPEQLKEFIKDGVEPEKREGGEASMYVPGSAPEAAESEIWQKWRDAQARIASLESQVASWKDAHERAAVIAAEEANRQTEELKRQLEGAKHERDNCAKSALEVLGSCFCDTHSEKVKQISFLAFLEWVKDMGCHACASARAESAEAKLAEAEKRGAEIVARAVKAQVQIEQAEAREAALRNAATVMVDLLERCKIYGPADALREATDKLREIVAQAALSNDGRRERFTDGHLFTLTTDGEPLLEYVRKGSRLGFNWGPEPSWFIVTDDGHYSASGYLDSRLNVEELRKAFEKFADARQSALSREEGKSD